MKKIEEASFFYEISETLNEHLELKKSLYKVLDILSSSLDMARGTITLLDPVRNEIRIEVAHGITQRAMQRVTYKLGRGSPAASFNPARPSRFPKSVRSPNFSTARCPAEPIRTLTCPLSVSPSKKAVRSSAP